MKTIDDIRNIITAHMDVLRSRYEDFLNNRTASNAV